MSHLFQVFQQSHHPKYGKIIFLPIALSIITALGMCGCQKTNQTNQQAATNASELTDNSVASVATAQASTSTIPLTASQPVDSTTIVQQRLAAALPKISYTTDNLSSFAKKVNQASYLSEAMPTDSRIADTTMATVTTNTNTNTNTNKSASTTHQPLSVNDSDYQSNIDYTALRQHANTNKSIATANHTPKLDEATIIKIQALLNWHGHSVGAVNGTMNNNVIKAMQIFQQKHQLPITTSMNEETWQALTQDEKIANQPVLVNYKLTRQDLITTSKPKDMQYHTAREAVAEKFHMSQQLVSKLNPNTPLKAGNIITVYNPYQPNMTEVTKVVSDKKKNILYAYDATGELVASYPTTVGSHYTPSPSGNLVVKNRVLNPTYNPDFSSTAKWLPPGPNNPVGRVWIGLSKRSFGIHGSPEPELISQQKSHGCVRLTNWDALALYGTIADGAEVIFL